MSAAAVGFHPAPIKGLGSICLVQNEPLPAERGRCPVCQGCLGSPLAAWAVRWLCAVWGGQGEATQGQLERWHKVCQGTAPVPAPTPSTEPSAHRSCTVVEGRGEPLQAATGSVLPWDCPSAHPGVLRAHPGPCLMMVTFRIHHTSALWKFG